MRTAKPAFLVLVLFCASFAKTNAQCIANAYFLDSIFPNGTVHFIPYDTASVNTYQVWNFGDGETSNDFSPIHQYMSSGTYYVCLYNVYSSGTFCVDSFCRTIQVTVPACSGFTVSISDILQPQPPGHTLIAVVANDSAVTYHWSGGQTSPSISVTISGTYCVTVTGGNNNCTASACDSVHIPDTCTANYTYQLLQPFGNVQFTNTSTSPDSVVSYIWYFGDDSTSTQKSPLHVYPAPGVYYSCLRMLTVSGCLSYKCDSIHINPVSCSGVTAQWTYTATGGAVQFTAVDTGTGATHHDWNFGDGSQEGFGPNPSHTYTTSGTYHVCQYVYVEGPNSVLCNDSSCYNVTIIVSPNCNGVTAAWIYSENGAVVTFTAIDTANVNTTHTWSFGDGLAQGSGSNPAVITHTYAASGSYRVCQYVFVVNNIGALICSDSSCYDISVILPPDCNSVTASWTATNLPNGNVLFTSVDTSSGDTHHIWSFGDNTSSYDVNPNHAYATAGTYHVCQYVYIVGTTCTDSFCMNIQVGAGNNCGNFHAEISVSPDSASTTYRLAAEVSGGTSPYSYKWSSSANATGYYTYATSSGNYCVTVSDINGCTTVACDSVHITPPNPCIGLTAAWHDSIFSNGNIQFLPTDISTNVIHGWSFGDGTTSGNFDPIHAYDTAGIYHVCQYVYVAGSGCVDSFCTNIEVPTGTSCAGFGVFIHDVTDSLNSFHQLTAVSTATDFSWATYRWSTGDSIDDVINVYTSGNYCVKVTYSNGCYAYACDSVVIGPVNPCAGLNASWTPTDLQNGGIQFNGVPNPVPVSNYWSFGDGIYSTNADPIYYYVHSGLYTVCHYVYNPGNSCVDSACRAIQAPGSATCHASFTYQATNTGGPGKIYFTSTSTSNDSIIEWNWNFGDGETGSGALTEHIYGAGGTYYACLTIATATGCTSTYCDSVTVGGSSPCQASFTWRAINCLTVAFENTSPPGYVMQRWIYGDGTTDTVSNPYHTYTQSGTYTVILHDYYTNCYSFDTMTITLPSCNNNDTICGVVFEDLNNDGYLDTTERGIIGVTVHVGGVTTTTDSSGYYRVILPAGNYYVYIITPAGCIPTLPLSPDSANAAGGYNGYYVTGKGGGTYCGYNFGVDCNVVHVCGTVYFDANDNGVFDSTENGIPNVHVIITDSSGRVHNTYTSGNGEYCETLPAGYYTITVVDPYDSGSVTPSSIHLNATGAGQIYGNNNFGIYIKPGACDLSINLTAHSTVTAGFPAWYSIEVCNIGGVSSGGTASMFYDPALTFNYAYPAQTSYNASTETLTWNVNSLDPGQCSYFWVAFTADAPLQIGQPVFTLADINPGTGCNDVNFNNNVDTVQQVVTGSWDPNSKVVSPIGVGPQGYINGSQELKYTINFQNTGTAPAVNIVVQDTLSGSLNPETFRMIGASNTYTMQMEGNEVVWKFSNIMLPDSSVNEQASHGYITYAITPNLGLAQATQIQNTADIYFDYNQGVASNTTLNTVDLTLSVNNLTLNNVTITLQPNPFRDYTTIRIAGAEAPYQLVIYDLLGNTVNSITGEQNTFNIDRGTLAAGMYLYEVFQQGKIIGKGKMVAQ